ncbi:MAG TPA: hypothetical protein VFU31_24830 [Candidatus Binatia bacterium]|nr:hypothetical protein [Candidatus Binatia bacterium]
MKAVAVLVLCLISGGALAEDRFYFTAGIGKSVLPHTGANKWWIQKGWDYTIDEYSTVYKVGFGFRASKYLSLEVTYHDLGEYHHFAGFMVNEDLYDPATHDCNGHCSQTSWGYLSGSADAFSFSLVPTYPLTKRVSIYGRLGLARYRAKFIARVTPDSQFGRHWTEITFSQNGYSPVYGLGVSYKNVSLEANHFPNVEANNGCCSAYQDAIVYTLNYRWAL